MAQTSMTFRVDNSLKRNFDILCNEFGFSSTAAITVFMKTVVRERKIPFEIKAGNTKEIKLRKELATNAHPKLNTTLYQVQILNKA